VKNNMWMPQYQTYYAVHLDNHVELWSSMSFNKILVLEYPDANLSCTATTDATGSVNIDFLYPLLVQSKYFIDGILDGHVTFKSDATIGRTCTDYSVGLNKLNNAGGVTNIGYMSYTFSPTFTTTVANQYLTVPIYMQIDKQPVNENEKLFLRIKLGTAMTTGQWFLSHANDSSVPDIKIRIPFAPTG
jgi:hypothetical protein